jgi:cytoskeleton-associated protein 5
MCCKLSHHLRLCFFNLQVGDPKDAVKNSVHGIFKTLWRIYPASKLFPYAMEGIKTKNARQRTGIC